MCILCVSQKQKVCIPCECGYALTPGLDLTNTRCCWDMGVARTRGRGQTHPGKGSCKRLQAVKGRDARQSAGGRVWTRLPLLGRGGMIGGKARDARGRGWGRGGASVHGLNRHTDPSLRRGFHVYDCRQRGGGGGHKGMRGNRHTPASAGGCRWGGRNLRKTEVVYPSPKSFRTRFTRRHVTVAHCFLRLILCKVLALKVRETPAPYAPRESTANRRGIPIQRRACAFLGDA